MKQLELELQGHELKKVVLMTEPQCQHWVVEVENGRYFKNGWSEFCKHHSLGVGDFLVFKLQAQLIFHVTVFDPATACERHYLPSFSPQHQQFDGTGSTERMPQLTSSSRSEPLKEAAEAAQQQLVIPAQSELLSYQIMLTASSIQRNILYIPTYFARPNGLHNRKCDVTVVDGEERRWDMRLSFSKSGGQTYLVEGWRQLQVANCFIPGDIVTLEILKAGERPTFKCYSSAKRSLQFNSNSKRKTLKAPAEAAQQQLPLSPAQSQLLSCQIMLTASAVQRHILYIPRNFARSNGLHNRCDVTVVDGEERRWEMRLSFRKNGGQIYLVEGWKQLQVANCFNPGDIVTLQILKAGERPTFKCYSSTKSSLQFNSSSKRKPLKEADESVQLQLPLSPAQSQSLSCQLNITASAFKRNIVYLPLHFARSNGLIKRKCDMTLVDGEERQWDMRLSYAKSSGQPLIVQGWREFQVANCLKQGDTLSLQLLKAGEKPILKCYSSAKRSLQFTSSSKRRSLKATAEAVQLQLPPSPAQSQSLSCQYNLTASTFKRNILYLPMQFARSNGLLKRKCYMTLVDGEERQWEMRLSCLKSSGQPFIVQGWKQFQDAICLKPGDSLTLQLLKAGEKPILKCYCSTNRTLQSPLSPAQSEPLLSCQVNCSVYSFKRNIIYLPMGFARSNGLLERKCDITLVDGEERHWEMMLSFKKDSGQPYIIQGWKQVQVANGFKPGDILTLQLLKAGEKPILKCYNSLKTSSELSNFKSKPSTSLAAVTQVPSLLSQSPNCHTRLSRSCFKQNYTELRSINPDE